MILSCTTCCLRGRGRDEIEETFRWAPEAGFTAWGLGGPFTWEPGLIQWLDVARLKERAHAAGLTNLTEVWSPPISTVSPELAEAGAQNIAMCADVAEQLGCSLLVQTGGPRTRSGMDRTIKGLLRLDELLGDKPIRVALEPHVGSQILHADDYARLLAELPRRRFGVTVDTGHFHSAGVEWKSLMRAFPDRILNVHVKDHVGPQSVAIGTGEVDLAGLVTVLREIGYDGALAIEMEVSDPDNLPTYVRHAYEYMFALLNGGGD